jgi:hypothetical protein
MTVGFPQGRSDYEPEPGVLLGYVGHGFKRFPRNRTTWRSAGIWGACCPIRCPSQTGGRGASSGMQMLSRVHQPNINNGALMLACASSRPQLRSRA